MKLSAILEPLVEAGVDAATILKAVKAWEAQQVDALERRRANDRERQERRRHVKSRDVTVTVPSRAGVTRVEDITSNLEIAGQEENKKENARDARSCPSGFNDFWTLFPNKVGKRDAEKAFSTAIRRAPFEAIMAGLRRYVAKTDDRPWCNPATFLNQNRWEDQPAPAVAQRANGPPRKPTPVDAMNEIFRERGWTTDEPEFVHGHNGHAQRLPAERGRHQGPDLDLREGPDGHFGPGDH